MDDDAPAIDVSLRDDGTIVVAGDVDAHSIAELSSAIDAAGGGVKLDLGAVGFIDSSGIRVLVETQSRCRDVGTSFRIVEVSAPVRRLFEITGLTSYLLGEQSE